MINENQGGSGGFFLGEKKAIELDCNWILVSDDDAYPEKKYIEKASDIIITNNNDNISVVCGLVKQYGNFDNFHRAMINSKWNTTFSKKINLKNYKKNIFEIDLSSYVGPIINKDILVNAGLINKDFFIWNDDIEHMIRLSKFGKIFCSKNMIIEHDVEIERTNLTWKTYYGFRNYLYMVKKHFKLQFLWILFLMIVKAILCPIKGKSLIEVNMRLIAIKDAIFNNLGKNKTYKPGWKP